jgi:hypothetical protein
MEYYQYDEDVIQYGHYMGSTSYLEFKVEPDKTIELDDGRTLVGSEKLSLTFNILGEITEYINYKNLTICNIILVPEVDGPLYNYPPIIIIDLKDMQGKVKIEPEIKSGEIQKYIFSLEMRYEVNHRKYRFRDYDEYIINFIMILMDNYEEDITGYHFAIINKDNDETVYDMDDPSGLLIKGKIAVLNLPGENPYRIETSNGLVRDIEDNSGIVKIQWHLGE